MHSKRGSRAGSNASESGHARADETFSIPTFNANATSSTLINFMRRAVEVGGVKKSDSKLIVEAQFAFTPGDYFHVVIASSERIMHFARAHRFYVKTNIITGHMIFTSEDFMKLKTAFLTVPGRKVIEETIAVDADRSYVAARAASSTNSH